MAPRWFGRIATLALASSALVAFVACDDEYYDGYSGRGHRRSCENPVRQCQTVCRDYCDAWGCYPYCDDDCWTDCDDGASAGASGAADAAASVVDAGPAALDAASPVDDGGAALCAPCATNADCQEGALCIFYGVPSTKDGGDADAAPSSGSASFCGAACTGGCPTGFTCATLGSRQQCVPSAGRCN